MTLSFYSPIDKQNQTKGKCITMEEKNNPHAHAALLAAERDREREKKQEMI